MKKYIIPIVIIILCAILMISCQKGPKERMDDTWYILDNYAILLLCESQEEDYIEAIDKLKGNGADLETAVDELNQLGDSAKIQNAIGVAYLRLREMEKAGPVLTHALESAETAEERACILTNLAEVEGYNENEEKQYQYFIAASEEAVEDPIRKLAIESNRNRMQMTRDVSGASSNIKAKKMLREEKKMLGSNQLIGIHNYKVLALGCYYDDRLKNSVGYLNKALELNESLYQNSLVQGDLYRTLSFVYRYQPDNQYIGKSLECAEQCINSLEDCQTENHYDLLSAYEWRGNLFLDMGETDKALQDYKRVTGRCNWDYILSGAAYYNIGFVYIKEDDTDKAIEAFSKAYVILKKYEKEKDVVLDIVNRLKSIFESNLYINQEGNFEQWFSAQELLAEKKLKEGR